MNEEEKKVVETPEVPETPEAPAAEGTQDTTTVEAGEGTPEPENPTAAAPAE